MSLEEDLRRKPNKNWLKAAFALKCLKEGIEPFVESQINQQHAKILVGLQHSCNSCSLVTLLPPHALKVGLTCAKGRQRCLCIGSKRIIRSACPNKICGMIYDRIVDSCVFCYPFWNNTDISKWTVDSWEIAKCYINIPGYQDRASAHDTDCLGLLTIIINNMEFWKDISIVIDNKTDVFTKVKQARNKIMHSPTLEVTDSQLNDYVKDMIAVLEDLKHLKSGTCAVSAKTKLQKILQDDIYISTKDEIQLREESLKAIEEETKESVRQISDIKSETLEEMKKIKDKHTTQLAGIQQVQTAHTADIKRVRTSLIYVRDDQDTFKKNIAKIQSDQETLKGRQTHIEKRVDSLEIEISSLKKVKNTHQTHLEYLQKKLAVQTKLCEMYQQHLLTVSVSPILSDIEANIEEVFVDLVLCDDLLQKRKSRVDEKSSRIVKSYQDIFFSGKYLCKNIYLLADAGMGKTTWCVNFLRTWATTVKNNTQELADQKTCANFEIVVFIPLREFCKETEILNMIKEYIFAEDTRTFDEFTDVLRTEPEKCLIILDGLDEWNMPKNQTCSISQNPHIPLKKNLCGCTVLITSRKWKIFNIKLRDSEFDKAIEIRGIKDQKALAERVIKSLNDINDWNPPKKYEDFDKSLETVKLKSTTISFQLTSFMNVPFILIAIVCLWCEKGRIEISSAANYLALTEILIKHAETRATGKEMQKDIEDKPLLNGLGSQFDISKYQTVLLKMAEVAFNASVELTSLVIDERLFHQFMTKEELQTCLTLGFISQSKSIGKVLTRSLKISFLHKSLQEFFAAVHIVSKSQNNNETPMKNFKAYCHNFEKLSENENILLFVCGLDPRLGSELSFHVSQLVNISTELDRKKYITYTLPLKCIIQVHESDKGYPSRDFPIKTSNTCVTIDQLTMPIANYLILLLQCGSYTRGMAKLIIDLTRQISITRVRPLTASDKLTLQPFSNLPKSLGLSILLPACLTECSLIYIDLTKFTVNELTRFGQSFQRLTELEYLTLRRLSSSHSFIINLLDCSNLKKVIAREIGTIVLLFSKAVLFRKHAYESHNISKSYDYENFVLTRDGMSQPICSVKEKTENIFTTADKEAFYKMYFFVIGQESEPKYDVRNLSLSFSKIPFLGFCPFMNEIVRQYDIKTNCVTFDIRFKENVEFELFSLLRLMKKMKSLRNYTLINGNEQCVEVTNSEFGETHLTCKALTCEEQKAIKSFWLLNQRRLHDKTKTIDIACDALHEMTESALKSESLSTVNVEICSDAFSECSRLGMLKALKEMRNLICLNIHQNSNKFVDVKCEFKKSILGTVYNGSSSKVEMKGLSEKEEETFLSILESHKMFKCVTIKVLKVNTKICKPALIDLIANMPFLVVLNIETTDSILSENMLTGILNAMKYKKCFRDLFVSDTTDKVLSVLNFCKYCDGFMQCKNCLTGKTHVQIKLIKHTPSVQNAFICLLFMSNIAKDQSITEIEIACDTFQQSFLELIRLQSCHGELMVPMDDMSDAKWERLLQNIGNLKCQSDIDLIGSNNAICKIANYEVPEMRSVSTFQTGRVFEMYEINDRIFHPRVQELKAEESAKKQTLYLKIMRSPKISYGAAETFESISINLSDETISSNTLIQHFRTINFFKYLKCVSMVDDVFNVATIRSSENYSIPGSTGRKKIDITCRGLSSEAEDTFFTLILSLPMLKTHVVDEVYIVCSTFNGALLNLIGCTGSLKKLTINSTNGTLTDDISLKLFRSLEKTSTLQYLYVQDKDVKTEETYASRNIHRDGIFMKQVVPKKMSIEVKEAFESFLKSHPALEVCIIQDAILV